MGKRGQDSGNDEELWARVAGSARPLRKRPIGSQAPSCRNRRAKPRKGAVPPAAQARAESRAEACSDPAGRGARPAERHASSSAGKLAVEARLDLHGMRQREAHAALGGSSNRRRARAIATCWSSPARAPPPIRRRSFYEEDERGVLRQAVPHWLAAPDLAHVVVSFSQAPRRLGGEGALYVRLRKPRLT